ncbi:hypothetical protein IVA79_08470 [Bradyrhizobium sp. 138]|nr:hypothetical protein [Bradyrhizobium sp. 138]
MPFNNAAERALRGFALGRKAWLRIPTIARMYSDLMPRSFPI